MSQDFRRAYVATRHEQDVRYESCYLNPFKYEKAPNVKPKSEVESVWWPDLLEAGTRSILKPCVGVKVGGSGAVVTFALG